MRAVVLWLVIAALLATVWWLASERNERHYSLSTNGTQLLVSKGHFFPTGTSTVREKPYEPFAIPTGEKVPFSNDVDYDDQNALDRALFDILYGWAKDLTKKDAPAALSLAERASDLPGLTAAQLGQLQALRAELSYSAAHDELQQLAK